MSAARKHLRMAILVAVTLLVLALVIVWSRRPAEKGFATPAECLDVYCNASKTGNAERYLSCLAEPLRSEMRQRFPDTGQLGEHLRLGMSNVSTWAQHPEMNDGSSAVINLEEVHGSSGRWIRFHLERSGKGWLITHIGQPEEKPLSFRPGTPVDELREGSRPAVEP
jgi:hypothetical protein